jgi:hypothetical protein
VTSKCSTCAKGKKGKIPVEKLVYAVEDVTSGIAGEFELIIRKNKEVAKR